MALLASVLIVVAVAGGALLLTHSRRSSAPTTAAQGMLSRTGPGTFRFNRGFAPILVWALDGWVYAYVNQEPSRTPVSRLVRIDPNTGRVGASVNVSDPGNVQAIGGALWWVDTSAKGTTSLIRADPLTLRILSSRTLPRAGDAGVVFARAGRWTWVGDRDELTRVDSATGDAAEVRLALPGAATMPAVSGRRQGWAAERTTISPTFTFSGWARA